MRGALKTIGNAFMVVAGFFVVLFAVSRVTGRQGGSISSNSGGGAGVAYADAPSYSQGTYGDGYAEGSYSDGGGDSGSDSSTSPTDGGSDSGSDSGK